jgi:site-specific DNA-methyltransferase (adenine-specific)
MSEATEKARASRNRTLKLGEQELRAYQDHCLRLFAPISVAEIENKTICQDINEAAPFLPTSFVDLLFLDPPYNLTKQFNNLVFKEVSMDVYCKWFESWFVKLLPILKPTASIYICGDWRSSGAIQTIAEKYLKVHNRITWEREKGRGAKANWKNCSEDIWFCTVSDDFYFDADAVKLKRKVIAPYKDEYGRPKDWEKGEHEDYRLTHPSNVWTDLTVPFWSMSENTDHPTQKPEKLLAKIILASSRPNDFVFDPFLGSGTTSVVAKKLGRRYCGIEIDPTYCGFAQKRLEEAESDPTIQGYSDGVFWERNTYSQQNGKRNSRNATSRKANAGYLSLFDEPSQSSP